MTCSQRLTALALSALLWPAVSWAGAPAPFAPKGDQRLLLRHAMLLNSQESGFAPDMDVLIAGERILAVTPDDQLDPHLAEHATVLDLSGRYVIPGLIDAHVHLATPPNRRQAEAVLRRDLYGGVTAVRDMADDLRALGDLSRAALVGEIAAPDIYYAALMAGPEFFTDRRTILVSAGGLPGHVPWMQAVTDATDIPIAVAEARGTFATALKLYAAMTPELATRITAEAHRQHMLVWAHATLFPAKPSDVVGAGVDAISHSCLLVREPDAHVPAWSEPRTPPPLDRFRGGTDPVLARLFAEMVRRGTILDATIWAYAADQAGGSASTPALPPGSCDDVVGGAITGQAYRAGVQIDAGTDAVANWDDPWPDLFHEITALSARAGMPNAAVLRSATIIAARAAGQQTDMGSIEPGKLANMAVLAKDPLADLGNVKTIVMTIKRGRIFERRAFAPLQQADITDQ